MKSKWWLIGLLVSLALACLAPLASSSPDGLERVAEDKGFIGLSKMAPFQVMADYLFPGVRNGALATILAGLLGTLIIFGLAYGISWLMVSRQKVRQ